MPSHDTLIILGAGGHGRVIADIALALGSYRSIAFLADALPEENFPYSFLGSTDNAGQYLQQADFIVGIGNCAVRRRFQEQLVSLGAKMATLLHPSAVIGSRVKIGVGTVAMPGAIVNADARIGNGVILNTASSIDHDTVIGDFCHIAPGAHLCGTVNVGADSFLGAGTTVINNITIPPATTIGAGSVVVHSLSTPGTYAGVPARLLA